MSDNSKKNKLEDLEEQMKQLYLNEEENKRVIKDSNERLQKLLYEQEEREKRNINGKQTKEDEEFKIKLELALAQLEELKMRQEETRVRQDEAILKREETRLKIEKEQLQIEKEKIQIEKEKAQIQNLKKNENKSGIKINPTQRTFSGFIDEKIDIKEWLYILNLNMEVAGVEEEKKAIIGATYLRGNASQIYRQASEKEELNWEDFKELMEKNFLKGNNEVELIGKLWKLKQDETVEKYVERFRYLLNQTKEINENVKINMFKNGLEKDVLADLEYQEPETIDAAIKCAEKFARSYGSGKMHKINIMKFGNNNIRQYPYTFRNNFTGNCNFCGYQGHMEKDCFKKQKFMRNKNESKWIQQDQYNRTGNYWRQDQNQRSNYYNRNQTKEVSQVICYLCQQKGHYSNNCPQQNNKNNINNRNKESISKRFNNDRNKKVEETEYRIIQNENRKTNNNIENIETNERPKLINKKRRSEDMEIGMIEHSINTFYELQFQEEIGYDLIKVDIEINNNDKEIIAVLDSGATRSVLSEKIANELNLKINEANENIKLIIGGKHKIVGVTEIVKVSVLNTTTKISFIVLPSDSIDCLLGLDFFHKTGCILDVQKGKVEFRTSGQFKGGIKKIKEEEEEDILENEVMVISTEYMENDEIENEYQWESKVERPKIEEIFKEIEEITKEENKQLKKILKEYENQFAYSLEDLKVPCNILKHEIRLMDDIPVVVPQYRRSPRDEELIDEKTEQLLRLGLIRKSEGAYSAEPVVIRSPGKEPRMCIDYTAVNKKTIKDPFPLPRVDTIIDSLANNEITSTLDAKSGYNQIEVEEKSKPPTAFRTRKGTWEWNRMPFGGKGGPATFHRVMSYIFNGLTFIFIFFDDIIIKSRNIKEHFEHLEEVFKRLKQANLKLNPKKCKFFRKELNILGFTISKNTVKMDKDKIEVIKNWPIPKTIKPVHSFLGLAGFYRRFIKNFSIIAAPLYKLLQKNVKFNWTPTCQTAFDQLKKCLTSYPILRIPDFSKTFYLYTDASGTGIGGILCQRDENDTEFVIQYGSRLLRGAEINYAITELELLAVVYFCKTWKYYLLNQKFYIITDHSALLWLFNLKDKTGRLMRWYIFMTQFNYEIKYKPGKIHRNVDALSRIQTEEKILMIEESETSTKYLDPFQDKFLLSFLQTGKLEQGLSKKQIKRIQRESKKYFWKDENLWLKTNEEIKERKIPKLEDRETITKEIHAIGHFDEEATYLRLKQKYYWKNMRETCKKIHRNCLECLRNNKCKIINHPALAIPILGIFDKICLDLSFGFEQTPEGYIGILVIIEYLSKYPWIVPIKSKSADEIARNLFKYITTYGCPKWIISDLGNEMNNEIFQNLCKLTGIIHRTTSPFKASTDGLVEKHMYTFANVLRKLIQNKNEKHKWIEQIDFILLAYRTKINSTTKQTPFFLLYGRQMNMIDDWENKLEEDDETALFKRTIELKKLLQYEHGVTIKQIQKMQEIQKHSQDNRNHIETIPLEIGATCFLKDSRLMKDKLDDRFKGPYSIYGRTPLGNYWLMDENKKILKYSYPREKLKIAKDFQNKNADRFKEDLNEMKKQSELINDEEEELQIHTQEENEEKCASNNCLKPNTNNINWIQCDKCDRWYHMKCENIKIKNKKENFLCKICQNKIVEINVLEYYLLNEDKIESEIVSNYNKEEQNKKENKMVKKVSNKNDLNKINKKIIKNNKKKSILNMKHLFLMILLSIIQTSLSFKLNPQEIKGNFKYCNVNQNSPSIDTDYNCSKEKTLKQTRTNEEFSLLEKRDYMISGYGYHCKRTNLIVTTWKTFFGKEVSTHDTEEVETSVEICKGMLISKTCGEEKMFCDINGNHCEYKEKPNVYYSWVSTYSFKKMQCEMTKVLIYANDDKEKLYQDAVSECYAKNFYCMHKNSVTIWNNSIIHKCVYFRIKNEKFNQTENLMLSDYNLFQINGKYSDCNMTIYSTQEGIFLSKASETIELMKSDLDYKNNFHLEMGDIDLKTYKLLAITNKIGGTNQHFQCSIIKTILQNFKKEINNILTITNSKKEEITLINEHGLIKVTNCLELKTLSIAKEMMECFRDLQVIIQYNHKNTTGFLSDNGVIKKFSEVIPCYQKRIIEIPNSTVQIFLEGKYTKIINSTQKRIPINFEEFLEAKINFTHDITTIDNPSLYKEIKKYNEFRMGEYSYYAKHSDIIYKENEIYKNQEMSISEKLSLFIHKILVYSNLILTFILIISIIIIIIKYNVPKRKTNKIIQNKQEEEIELKLILPTTSKKEDKIENKKFKIRDSIESLNKWKLENSLFKRINLKLNSRRNSTESLIKKLEKMKKENEKGKEELEENLKQLEELEQKQKEHNEKNIFNSFQGRNVSARGET